ncbi:MAG: SusC/RagA family TonB-linked outer membrane protein [Candidatus Palauibacterales bacterium]|nr:SusC/RagA family TonB-linked outer membrane protein [Candidatus Palauibacterales bacterium]
MSLRPIRRVAVATAALLALGVFSGAPALAQQGAVTGTVTRSANQEPLDAAQVVVVGTGLGTITDAEGNYRITGVPAGEQQVRVQLVGYSTSTRTVTVQSGQAATANFRLSQSAVEMEQIVVTGTGTGGVQQKKLGNTIGTIDAEEVTTGATGNMSEVLSGREPGVNVLSSSGLAGEGSQIKIRGSASLTQSNEPIVYVDGVRVNTGGEFAGTSAGDQGTGASSRLDDINPQSIERVEVLKGAAAATLYGTEASNGVIQIFTKSGREGSSRWNLSVQGGAEFMPTNRLKPLADFPRDAAQADRLSDYYGMQLEPYQVFTVNNQKNRFDEVGRSGEATLSVNGGGEGITYFLSGRWSKKNGIVGLSEMGPATDENTRVSSTANVNVYPSDEIRVQLRTNYAFTDQSAPNNSNFIYGLWPMISFGQLRLANEDNEFGAPAFATVEEIMQQTTSQEVDHYGGSVQLNVNPSQEVTLNGTFGIDVTSNRSEHMVPFGWNVNNFAGATPDGARDIGVHNHTQFTAELRSGWDTDLGEDFSSSLTFGTQGFLTEEVNRSGYGQTFPGPGIEVAGSASNQSVFESWVRNVNVGAFAQEQIGFRDFAYLTLGTRYDVNSAFGEDFSGVWYPKASFSLVPSDLDGWNSTTVSSFRVRGAIGQSGTQPGAFDKFRTFTSYPSVEGAGVAPGNLGNPELQPEVSTEWELGAEAGFFGGRASASVTYWDRTVEDALVSRQFPVSGGFTSQQLVNIGQLTGQGLDISASGDVVQNDQVTINVFGNASYLQQEVQDLGGAPPIKAGGSYPRYRNFVKEGFSPGAFFGAATADMQYPLNIGQGCSQPTRQELLTYFSQARSPDDFEVIPKNCEGDYLATTYKGKPQPDWSGSAGVDVSFLENFSFRSLFQYKAGNFYRSDLSGAFRQANSTIGRNTETAAMVESTLLNPASSSEDRLDAALTWANELRALSPMSGMNMIHPADYLRWREASLSWSAPQSVASTFSFRTMRLSLAARNVWLWVNGAYTGLDPELNATARCSGGGTSCNFLQGTEAFKIPIPRRFTFTVELGF